MVAEFDRAVSGVVAGLYVGGSLASGDYRPGVSDIDAVALVAAAPGREVRAELCAVHQRMAQEFPEGELLHCVYVAVPEVADCDRTHWTWAFGELFRRPLSVIARAELLADPVVAIGPHPSSWLPTISAAELREGARAELSGYWAWALGKRALWQPDVYVDLGLTMWARADATISEGVLISKSEAIARMIERGLLADVVDGVARRRAGERVILGDDQRDQRAVSVRKFLRDEFARLLNQP